MLDSIRVGPLVATICPELFSEHDKKSITVLSSTAVCLSCYNYLSRTKLLEGGLLLK